VDLFGRRRDLFAAMVCLWWAGINLLSVAIYCADSRAGQLTLLNGLTGQESDGHNWNNLLGAPAATGSPSSRVAAGHLPNALSVPLSIDSDIIRHPEAELRQITLSVNDLTVSCRTSYSPSVA
jgi:hypothetical protein